MKRIRKVIVFLLAFLLFAPFAKVHAETVPYTTWTIGPNAEVVDTQTAYIPQKMMELGLDAPEDLCVDENGTIYVCDTGNRRIAVLSKEETVSYIEGGELIKPTGIFAARGILYVADYGAQMVYLYDMEGKLLQKIDRPEEAILGKTKFVPMKLTVDKRGNIYVVSEGSVAGMLQVDPQGRFQGYFASNQTNTTFKMILQKTIFTQEQLNKLFKNTPPSVTNTAIDSQGLIYTVTKGLAGQSIKKLSISGKNLFASNSVSASDMIDVTVDRNGNVFGLSESGTIMEYDSYGTLLFAFGSKSDTMDRNGLLTGPAAIDVLEDGRLVVLDKAKGLLVFYEPTEFANQVHLGITYYKDGKYAESETIWQDIKKMNSAFLLSYDALAKSSYKRQEYETALDYYKIAENKTGYSQTFWVLRNQWIEHNIGAMLLMIAAIAIYISIRKKYLVKTRLYQKLNAGYAFLGSRTLVRQLSMQKQLLRRPLDAYYDMRFRGKVSVLSATLLYLWFFVLQITDVYLTGYLFNNNNVRTMNLTKELLNIAVVFGFWIICNYLVSTITEGEGKLKDIYCGTIYALSPYLMFSLLVQLGSNLLTQNEAFVYTYSVYGLYAWCGILLFMMVKEMHGYTVKQTVKNLLITLFTIILFALAAFICYLLAKQLIDFVVNVVQEVSVRG